MKSRQLLEQENNKLRKELLEQWEYNHSEHCQFKWPHDGICNWPLPTLIQKEEASEVLRLLASAEEGCAAPH